MRFIKGSLVFFLLVGCAGQENMRHLAGSSATVLNDYRRGLKGFADRQTSLNTDIEQGIRDFAELQSMRDGALEQRLLALRASGDKPALDTYALLASRSAADIVAQSSLLRAPQPAAAAPAVTFDASALERVTTQLNELRRPRSFWEQVLRAVTYRNELQQAYQASLQKASDDAAQTSTQTVSETNTLVTGATRPHSE